MEKFVAERKIVNNIPESTFPLKTFPLSNKTKTKTDAENSTRLTLTKDGNLLQLTVKADEKCWHVVDGDH